MNTLTTRLVDKREFISRLATTESAFWRLRERGIVPAPIYLGPKSPRWPAEVVETTLAAIVGGAVASLADAQAATSKTTRTGRPRKAAEVATA